MLITAPPRPVSIAHNTSHDPQPTSAMTPATRPPTCGAAARGQKASADGQGREDADRGQDHDVDPQREHDGGHQHGMDRRGGEEMRTHGITCRVSWKRVL